MRRYAMIGPMGHTTALPFAARGLHPSVGKATVIARGIAQKWESWKAASMISNLHSAVRISEHHTASRSDPTPFSSSGSSKLGISGIALPAMA